MIGAPAAVAVNTFREAVRDRVLYNLVFFALLMMGAAILVGQISIGIERLVIINLGLSAISIFGVVMAVFIGVGLVSKEIEKRTLYSLLSKPVGRSQFLAGKYGGLLLTLAVNTCFMTLGLAAALYYVGHPYVRSDLSHPGSGVLYSAGARAHHCVGACFSRASRAPCFPRYSPWASSSPAFLPVTFANSGR